MPRSVCTDMVLRDQGVCTVALSVHRDARASRWHYVSLPLQVGLARQADLVATRFAGNAPDGTTVETREITLFCPGRVNWPHLTSARHAGSRYIAKGVPVKYRHKESQLARYGIEMEFDREIRRQWWLTPVAGVLLIVSFAFEESHDENFPAPGAARGLPAGLRTGVRTKHARMARAAKRLSATDVANLAAYYETLK